MPTTYQPFTPGDYRSGSEWEKRLALSTRKGAPIRGGGGYGAPEYGLAGDVNRFMTEQARFPFETNLPGFTPMPQDVRNLISQAGAERGVMGGQAAGSPNANAAWLRALGLTSIGQQQAGTAGLTTAIQQTPIPEIWNPMSLYVPERLAQQELEAAQSGAYRPPPTSRTTYYRAGSSMGRSTPWY